MESIGKNIKKIREEKGLMQKEVASIANMQASNYSKIENGQRDISVEALDKIAKFFEMTVDELIHFEDKKIPAPVKVLDKTANEKIQLISQLDEEDKNAVYRIIDGMLTKNKFQNFFEQNLQSAK
ncbi:helix-turn-helix domain-containing protein [Epilithonimonas hominis]|uniref:Helix-turn-helix domain-containing protein n=1 Tax=Epilithonimonas hominis TaxID=420404 RepID=A0A3N0X2P8_9FLAO|nr:helix-turn-helix domain-containing protein [Epilithonimonas hominis]ROI11161.1 helix-turn-helix domain-containing protein [Epilithonimonas hominis]